MTGWMQHVLRELPSPPVSAPCCTALLKAHRKIFPLILVLLPPSRLWFWSSCFLDCFQWILPVKSYSVAANSMSCITTSCHLLLRLASLAQLRLITSSCLLPYVLLQFNIQHSQNLVGVSRAKRWKCNYCNQVKSGGLVRHLEYTCCMFHTKESIYVVVLQSLSPLPSLCFSVSLCVSLQTYI